MSHTLYKAESLDDRNKQVSAGRHIVTHNERRHTETRAAEGGITAFHLEGSQSKERSTYDPFSAEDTTISFVAIKCPIGNYLDCQLTNRWHSLSRSTRPASVAFSQLLTRHRTQSTDNVIGRHLTDLCHKKRPSHQISFAANKCNTFEDAQ